MSAEAVDKYGHFNLINIGEKSSIIFFSYQWFTNDLHSHSDDTSSDTPPTVKPIKKAVMPIHYLMPAGVESPFSLTDTSDDATSQVFESPTPKKKKKSTRDEQIDPTSSEVNIS